MARSSILLSHFTALEVCSGLAAQVACGASGACSLREALGLGLIRVSDRKVDFARIGHAPANSVARSFVRGRTDEVSSAIPACKLGFPVHMATSSDSQCRTRNDVVIAHRLSCPLPRRSVLRLSSAVLVCTPELAFVEIAGQGLPMVGLLELGYELCGTYRAALSCHSGGQMPTAADRLAGVSSSDTGALSSVGAELGVTIGLDAVRSNGASIEFSGPSLDHAGCYDALPLATVSSIHDFAVNNPSLRGSHRVRKILPYLAGGSASSRETKLALLLGLPCHYGGYGLGVPSLNYKVVLNDEARAAARRSFVRCDLCWPESKLDVEYQSRFAHEGEGARVRDSRRSNALASMGWKTVGVTSEELSSITSCDAVAKTVRLALGRKSRRTTDDFRRKNMELRYELGLPC